MHPFCNVRLMKFLTIKLTIKKSGLRCPRPLNRGVRLIQVLSTVNVGEKKWGLCCCPLNRGCPLNTDRFDCNLLPSAAVSSLFTSRNLCTRTNFFHKGNRRNRNIERVTGSER